MPDLTQSTHQVEVVAVELLPHPNADRLSLVRVGEYQVVVQTATWEGVSKGYYLQPDSVVPMRPEYEFLKGDNPEFLPKHCRIKARRLRKEWSQGLLMPLPPSLAHSAVGEDLATQLGVTRYEGLGEFSNTSTGSGKKRQQQVKGPATFCPEYSIDNWYKFANLLEEGEEVVVTEKLHGSNWRGLWDGTTLHIGSHRTWKAASIRTGLAGLRWWERLLVRVGLRKWPTLPSTDIWWKALRQHPQVEALLRANEGLCFYGEVFGEGVQDLTYDLSGGKLGLVLFDVWDSDNKRWLLSFEQEALLGFWDAPRPFRLFTGPYRKESFKELIDGKSMFAPSQLREGVVIETVNRRLKLKAVSPAYLERA